jgi:peroxiredoxin Q/BCP
MANGPQVGDAAPDFELEGTDGPFKLSDHRGERVVLLFYPGDETTVCTKQFCSYRDRSDEVHELDATLVGISPQSVDSHHSFIKNHGLVVPLLADRGLKVSELYGVKQRIVGTRRAVVIVDEQGIVRFRHQNTMSLTYDSVDDLREALAALPAPAA